MKKCNFKGCEFNEESKWFIEQSNGYPWNGWLVERETNLANFQAGLWWEYLQHLINEHREQLDFERIETIELQLDQIRKTWNYVMGREDEQ